jgi:methanogenic corrinoid protein MtbC1
MERLPQSALQRGASEDGSDAREDHGHFAPVRRSRLESVMERGSEEHPELVRAIEQDVLPQLVREHCGHGVTGRPSIRAVGGADVQLFTEIALNGDVGRAKALVETLRSEGVALESIYLDLLEPGARRLGTLWEADLCDFTEVTVALGRMQQVLRDVSADFRGEGECVPNGRRLLLVPAPGEQHTFGLFIVSDFFARAGWDVWGGPGSPDGDVFQLVRQEWFDIVGFSAGCTTRLDVLAADIGKVRATSRNPALGIMVGGPLFIADPKCVERVGADAMAQSARHAPDAALALLTRLSTTN